MEAKRTLIWLGLSATALLAAGCGDQKPETVAAAPSAATPSTPLPAVAARPKAEDTLTVTGPLIVEHQVDVTAQRDGIVANISCESGVRVKAGTVLADLDDRQLSANLEAARAKSRDCC